MAGSGMEAAEVHRVLDALSTAGCPAWVAGGWGVDALVGRQTRAHRDLDLAVDATQEGVALEALRALGYSVETDWRPIRVEVTAPGPRWVDLHPVRFDLAGDGVQVGPDGTVFTYPVACFVTGIVTGRVVPCLSVAQQLVFHRGYQPRAEDLHDLAVLDAARGTGT